MTIDFQPLNMIEPDFITLTDYERNFDIIFWRKTFRQIWTVSVYASVAYLVLIFGGAFLMRNRKPYKLSGLLAVWNIVLSIMSIWAFYRTLPEFTSHLSGENGLYHTVCEW